MSDGQEPRRGDLLREIVAWAVDHMEVEANFEGVPVLLVGDPRVLVDAPRTSEAVAQDSWSWLDLPSGHALVVRGPGGHVDGPWVWVLGSDDGPLTSIGISPSLETPQPEPKPEPDGLIDCGSGRIVIGSPESIAWWGPEVDVSEPDRLAEMRVGDVPGPLREGYIVIARPPEPGPYEVLVSARRGTPLDERDQYHAPRTTMAPSGFTNH